MDRETYFSLQTSLAIASKKAMKEVFKDVEIDEPIKNIMNKISLIALGDTQKIKNEILEISQILDIDTANTSIDQFLEKITNQP